MAVRARPSCQLSLSWHDRLQPPVPAAQTAAPPRRSPWPRGVRQVAEIPAIRLCTDEWQAALKVGLKEGDRDNEAFHDLLESQLWVHAQDIIRLGQSVIFEKGLWLRSERDEKRREARELGVDIELHYFDVPADELVRRLEKRNSEGNPNNFSISREQTEEYLEIFEPPDEAELALFPVSIVHRSGA